MAVLTLPGGYAVVTFGMRHLLIDCGTYYALLGNGLCKCIAA